ncbi:MAG: tRNA (adenosine(37)-N6)-threonylcarbamoyltransferase complex dimerization subunit type 1 TsaB [Anaerolineae bacterium]|nr:tRNA (adenosine(37)-N6)-threonylcarbamoyltransferase complex dimerization subunit type 1 TsaB [Anaerolineae bacterium]
MMLLAIDTATRYLGLALHDGQELIAEQIWRTGNKHNTLLASSIQQLLEVCDCSPADLTALAVSVGPGSYTGLRIGVSLAKGMASASNLPLIGVSSLDTLAAGCPFENTRYHLLTIVQAGRGRIISGEYRVRKGRWDSAADPQLTTWDELLAEREGSFYITGEINEAGREAIDTARSDDLSLTIIQAPYRIRRPGVLAQEAWRRYEAGEPADFHPAKCLPFYLQDPG